MVRRYLYILLIFFSSSFFSVYAETVKVGGYIFPPYLEKSGETYQGLTIEIIDYLNSFQSDYNFEFIETTSKRRYDHFDTGRFDIIMFEDLNWGWQNRDISYSDIFLRDGEVYITASHESKNQNYFNDFSGKKIAVILGYHYSFAEFISDEQYLTDQFDIQFSRNHEINILRVLEGISHISVVTKSYLYRYLNENPQYYEQLLISDKYDQYYNHRVLITEDSPIKADEMNRLLEELKERGILQRLRGNYGLE